MDKLTHTESSRVSNVLDDSVEKLALISFLPEQHKHGGVALLSELDETSYAAVSAQVMSPLSQPWGLEAHTAAQSFPSGS